MEVIELSVKETSNGKFYFADFGSETHGRTSFRLWVHYSLVERNSVDTPILTIPRTGIMLNMGKSSKTLILRPGDMNLFDIYVPCGYRVLDVMRFLLQLKTVLVIKYFDHLGVHVEYRVVLW